MVVETRTKEVRITTRLPHAEQERFRVSTAKRKVIRAGRRSGKTVGVAVLAIESFLEGTRVLYQAPTSEQTDAFWYEIKRALMPLVEDPELKGVYKANESERYIEKVGTKNRLKAKTAWNADSSRGDYGGLLIYDEYQLTNEDAWEVVGMPMLLDTNGDVCFIYTPPSLRSAGVSKAHDPRHAAKMFKMAQADTTGLWAAFHFTSHQNPYISQEALGRLAGEMSGKTYRQEILAEDDEVESSWLVHSKFNEALCKIKRRPIPFNWDIYSGHDFGSANPAALFGARVKLPLPDGFPPYMRQGDLVFFKEYAPGPGFSTAQNVARFKDFMAGYTIRRSRGGNLNSEDEIRQGYTKEGWTILPPALEKKNSQIDRFINLEENNKIYFFGDMWMLASEISNCLWKLKDGAITNEIDNEAIYHLIACLRSITSDGDFTPETVEQELGYATVSDLRPSHTNARLLGNLATLSSFKRR